MPRTHFAPPPLSEAAHIDVCLLGELAVARLRQLANGRHRIPEIVDLRLVFSDDETALRYEEVRQRNAQAVGFRNDGIQAFTNLAEVVPAVLRLQAEGHFPEPSVTDSAGRQIVDLPLDKIIRSAVQFLVNAVYEYLNERGHYTFEPASFAEVFVRSQTRRSRTHLQVRAIAPLANFTSDGSVDFGDGTRIEHLSGSEKTQIWKDEYLEKAFTATEVASCNFAITAEELRPRLHREGDIPFRFKRVIMALRLLQSGRVSAPATVYVDQPPSNLGGMTSTTHLKDILNVHLFEGGKYCLKTHDNQALVALYNKLGALEARQRDYGQFGLCLRRFSQSYERAYAEDRLIDLTVALEGSLLAAIAGELKYRVALRGATLLRDRAAPEATFRLLKALYDIRSTIAHNGETLDRINHAIFKEIDRHRFPAAVETCVRAVLIAFLDRIFMGESIADVAAGLDAEVLAALRPSEAR